jgi:hypothetical protein
VEYEKYILLEVAVKDLVIKTKIYPGLRLEEFSFLVLRYLS